MSAPLRVSYESPERLREQFESEIALGGLFIPTVTNLGFRDAVQVVFELDFCDERVELAAEVVGVVEPELARDGGEAGVAIQFSDPPPTVKERLGRFIGVRKPPERRRAPRRVARVPIRIEREDGTTVTGRTRNLSHSGVLFSVDGPPVPLGETVVLTLEHPTFDEALEVPARIVRYLEAEDVVTAMACMFEPELDTQKDVVEFINDVQTSEHARRLRGVTGAIGELGITNVIQVFGGCTRSGTLTVMRGYEEGRIIFEDGLLRDVHLGPVSGMKALSRIVGWRDGSFEFHSRVEATFTPCDPVPLEAALLEATRQQDEIDRVADPGFGDGTTFLVDQDKLDAERSSLSKVEDSVAELAMADMSLRQIVDVIPEPDGDVRAAVASLAELGVLHPA